MRNRIVRVILFAVAGSVFLISSFIVVKYQMEMRAGANQAEVLTQMVVTPITQESVGESTEATVDETTEPVEETRPKLIAPIEVDFEALQTENPDVVAWIYCPDTPIHYPVVQGEDNEYYLHRLLDGKSNAAGTLFMDWRNEADFSHWNSVIYGHNMKNNTMFGTLTDYKKQAYFDAHPQMYLLTPDENYLINLVAGFVTPADGDVYNALYPEDEEKEQLIESWLKASNFDSGYEPSVEDQFITLSTCSYEYNNARYVLIGTLSTGAD